MCVHGHEFGYRQISKSISYTRSLKAGLPFSALSIRLKLIVSFSPCQQCFSAQELVLIHGMANSSAASALDRSDLARLSPALVQQILSGACVGDTERPQPDQLTVAESK